MLRHFDELGLVSPARTSSGHRRYRSEDVTRLYRVLALRQMGLRLAEVDALLADSDPSPRATLIAQLERVEAALVAQQALRDRLVEVLAALDATSTVNTDQLIGVIEKMTMFDRHLSDDQRAWFTRRREQIGEQAWQEAIDQWPELVSAVQAEMDAGTDPADPRVQELMARWGQLQRIFLGDSTEMRTAAGRAWQAMWDQHADELRGSPRLAPPEMWHFIQRAQAAAGRE
jgi:DNA-binding transcriptional MerR regulator